MDCYLNARTYLEYLLLNSKRFTEKNAFSREVLDEINQKSLKSFEVGIFLPLEYLFEIFELNDFEKFCVLSLSIKVLTGEIYANTRDIIDIYASDDIKTRVECVKMLSDGEKLRKYFIEDTKNGVKLVDRIVSFGIFEEYENLQIQKFAKPLYGKDLGQDFEFLNEAKDIANFCKAHEKSFIFIEGPEGVGKKQCTEQLSHELNSQLLMVDLLAIVKKQASVLDDIMFEARISGFGICFYNFDVLLKDEDYFEILELITRAFEVSDLVICLSEREWHPHRGFDNFAVYNTKLMPPVALKRAEIWQNEIKNLEIQTEDGVDIYKIANKFAFTRGQIKSILFHAKGISLGGKISYEQLIKSAKLSLPSVPFGSKLIKINSAYQEEDLILPTYSKELLHTAVNRTNNGHIVYDEWGFLGKLPYGKGVSMIFAGPPGTGKTMGAQVVANLLSLDIYKINLAGVVSKYIGESEKNLEEVFDLGRKTQSILFFDEADVLFSKRTEVKDSNDKYSNMEAAFMLQKIEEYEGICILATNFIQNFDEAFKRRIKFIVDFPFPDETYRLKIWEKVFPKDIPLSFDIDYKFLAEKFELSGSNIKNIAVNAAFHAATAKEDVGMEHIIKALKIEYAKSGKKITSEELGHYFLMY